MVPVVGDDSDASELEQFNLKLNFKLEELVELVPVEMLMDCDQK